MAFKLPMPAAMKVLVAGGSGVVGHSTVTALVERGHTVRLLSRHASDDVTAWPGGVEAWPADVLSPASVTGSADGCEAILHLVAIVDEEPPERTFERVNVGGTGVMLREATRAGVRRFVYVSSLGADHGTSAYHRSKARGEALAREFRNEWVIVRPGATYGPGDDHLSFMLRMVRSLPVIPSIGDGSQRLQPLWHEDLAAALAQSVDRPGLAGRVLELAGPDVITQAALIERMRELTDRSSPTVPFPEFAATLGVRALNAAGITTPVSESQLEMLREENVIAAGAPNALVADFGIMPTSLESGLRRLLDEQDIQFPDEGVGGLRSKVFAVDVAPSPYDADRLFEYVRGHLLDLMPSLVNADPEHGNPSHIYEGATLTMALPLRGHIQVRVAEAAKGRITLMTVAGHPLAGAVRFVTLPIENGVHFEVQVFDRPASVIDWALMRPVGDRLQESTWIGLCESVARVAGASRPRVKHVTRDLDRQEARQVEHWAKQLGLRLRRKSRSADATGSAPRSRAYSDSGQTSDRTDPPARE
jgi:NADH dehydrogenase